MEVFFAVIFAIGLGLYVLLTAVKPSELIKPVEEARIKGLTEIFASDGRSVREALAEILGTNTAKAYVPKTAPEKKPRNADADLLRRCGIVGRFTKRQREARKARALKAGIPYYELRRGVGG